MKTKQIAAVVLKPFEIKDKLKEPVIHDLDNDGVPDEVVESGVSTNP